MTQKTKIKNKKSSVEQINKMFLLLNGIFFCMNIAIIAYVGVSNHMADVYKKLFQKAISACSDGITEDHIKDYFSANPTHYSTLETQNETDLLNKYLAKAKIYFEWGSGGSTFEALKHKNLEKVYSAENSASWLNDYMYRFQFIINNEKNGRLEMIYIDTGETGDWGYPTDPNADYSAYPETFISRQDYREADLILVDGRYRAACMLQAALNAKPGAYIMLHDSWREWYHPVYQFFNEIERVDNLSVFQVKNNIDRATVQRLYDYYKKDMR